MISQPALEEAILAVLCFHPQKAHLIALQLQDEAIFSNKANQLLGKTALEYVRTFNSAPQKVQLELLLEDSLRRGDEGKVLSLQIAALEKQSTQIDATFVIDQVKQFLDRRHMQASLEEAMELLEQGDLAKVREVLYKQQVLPAEDASAIQLFDPKQALSFLNKKEDTDWFSMGIDLMDERDIRPERKTLSFMIAPAGVGKSWWMIEIGKRAIQHHKKVLHITLELSDQKTAQRYLQAIFALTKKQAEQFRTAYFEHDSNNLVSIQFRELFRNSIIEKQLEITKSLHHMGKTLHSPYIKEFPMGSLSIEHLTLYIDSLERDKGFKPDLVIVDYADLMKINSEQLRIDTGRVYKELRGLAQAKDFAMVSASQGNRESATAKLVGSHNVAEDWSKIGTADNILTYSQTPDEKLMGLARIFAAKGRDSEDRFIALISQAYKIGQFSLSSIAMNAELHNQLNPAE